MTVGLIATTASGRTAAKHLAAVWPDARGYEGPATDALPRAFDECAGVVCFLSVGAVVRIVAPLLTGKNRDPGVVCVDEARRFAVPVVGAHAGGANALAAQVAAVLGCQPVITTASEAAGVTALDDFGADLGFRQEGELAAVAAAVLSGERVTLTMDPTWPVPPLPPNVVRADAPEPGVPAILVAEGRVPATDAPVAIFRPASLVIGVGASRGAPTEEIDELIEGTLAGAGLSPAAVGCLATVDAKAAEPGIVAVAAGRGWKLVTHPANALAAVTVPNPSDAVRAAVGTPSVAEAAALLTAGSAELVVEKRASPHATVAVARLRSRGRLTYVGLGPGARDLLTPRAVAALRRASVIVGLDQYVHQIRDLIRPGTRVIESGLGDEERRARTAVDEAREGHAVVLVGSGDAGVYGMAGPALALAGADIDVAGVPGVTAALAAANLLGAPLAHDHAVISLSDLHTPWEVIERRVRAAAEGDYVVAFYNARSRARDWQLAKALAVLAGHRPPRTPVGWVRAASRPGQRVALATLGEFDPSEIDMHTVVLVGSSHTRVVAGRMVTGRGYAWT